MKNTSVSSLLFIGQLCLLYSTLVSANHRHSLGEECVRLLAIGDWGTPQVVSTAKALAEAVSRPSHANCGSRPSSILMLGDNFYENGISSPEDPLFKQYFRNNFDLPAFDNITCSVVAGNHDHRGWISSQVEATGSKWYFPNLYYSRIFQHGNLRVLVAFIDTWELVGGEAEKNGDEQTIVDLAQMSWLRQVLSNNNVAVDFKIVVGHYPIRSAHRDTPGLVKGLLPVLKQLNVDLYLHGHDHFSQIILRDELLSIGSGIGGGRGFYGTMKHVPGLVWASSHELGFLELSFFKDELVVDFIEIKSHDDTEEAKVAYSYSIKPKSYQEDDQQHIALATSIRNRLMGDW